MGDGGPEQACMASCQSEGLAIHGVLHIAVKRDVDLHLSVPVVTGHFVGRTQLHIDSFVGGVERERAAQPFIELMHTGEIGPLRLSCHRNQSR
ncbi:hypothetical protein D3C72_2239280 [compost metagenome]